MPSRTIAPCGLLLRRPWDSTHRQYRARKARLKQILTRKPVCYLEHVAHGGAAQAGNDVRFRKNLFAFGKLVIQADKRKTV